jgi:hypothetical protein
VRVDLARPPPKPNHPLDIKSKIKKNSLSGLWKRLARLSLSFSVCSLARVLSPCRLARALLRGRAPLSLRARPCPRSALLDIPTTPVPTRPGTPLRHSLSLSPSSDVRRTYCPVPDRPRLPCRIRSRTCQPARSCPQQQQPSRSRRWPTIRTPKDRNPQALQANLNWRRKLKVRTSRFLPRDDKSRVGTEGELPGQQIKGASSSARLLMTH